MDYRFFVRDAGEVSSQLLAPVIEKVKEIGIPDTKIGRFNKNVYGITSGQYPDLDQLIQPIKDSLVGTIMELGDSDFINYHTINWLPANGYLKEHTDLTNGSSFDDMWTHKVHVPLITNEGARVSFRRNFTERADWHHLSVGRAWLYNNQVFHSVVNNGEARAHLILYARDKKLVEHMRKTALWTLLDKKNR